ELLGTSVPPVPALAAEERVSALLGGEPVGSPLRGVLRAVLPHVDGCADVVVLHPARATGTFVRARDVLSAAGVRMHRIALAELEPAALATDLVGDADPDVLRLGLRHYFVGVLGKTGRRTLEPKLLWQSMHRAEQFLARQDAADEVSLQEFVTPHSVVDVYRLTTTLLGRRSPFSADALMRSLYL
ncbi:MAG: hypothetical protein HOY71_43215, partial [Nonomuraea sp.]|nr:hypothetical protein [Nonomuraea sp.]